MFDWEDIPDEIVAERHPNKMNASVIGKKQSDNHLQSQKGHIKASDESQFLMELQNVYYGRRKSNLHKPTNCKLLSTPEVQKKIRKGSMNVSTFDDNTHSLVSDDLKMKTKFKSSAVTSSKLLAPEPIRIPRLRSASRTSWVSYLDIAIRASARDHHEIEKRCKSKKPRDNSRKTIKSFENGRRVACKSKFRTKREKYSTNGAQSAVLNYNSDRIITMEDILPC